MLRKGRILAISVIIVSFATFLSIDAQQDYNIPQWVKNNALWWGEGVITDADFISGINFLIDQKILRVSTSQDDSGWKAEADKLYKENQELKNEIADLKEKNLEQKIEIKLRKEFSGVKPTTDTKDDTNTCTPGFQKSIGKEFSAGPFRIHVISAGMECFVGDNGPDRLYKVDLEITNKRGTPVEYSLSRLILSDSNGYTLQHEGTNGVRSGTVISSGDTMTGFYTFGKPTSFGNFKLFIEVAVWDDFDITDNWYYSGEIVYVG